MQVGIATFPDDALTFEELLRKADSQPQEIAQVSDPSKSEDEIGLI
jgi:hypothetical protein